MSHTLTFHIVADGAVELAAEGESEAETTAATDEHSTTEEHAEEVKNPILPTSNEMFWGAVFFFLLWALFKFVLLPPILRVQEARAEHIRADKDAAERAAAEAAQLKVDYDAGLAGARAEAARIIDDARNAGEQKRAQVMARVDADIAAERAAAASRVDEAKTAALDELKSGVAGLAVEAAQLVVQKDIDEAAQRPAIDDYVSRAGTR